jgi:CDP-diacylglycerol--glycerol-3-phosphate 3-phosphatidyltransferase
VTEVVPKKKEVSVLLQDSAGVEAHRNGGRSGATGADHGPVVNIPNVITLGRVLLLVPLFYFLKRGEQGHGNSWALAIMAVALVTDLLDGFLARLLKQETDWGRVFDPLADKIWIAGLGIFLALPWRQNPLPWGFLALVLLRDLLIIAGGIHTYRRLRVVLQSNIWGKWAMFLTALTLIAYTVNFAPPEQSRWAQPLLLLWISVIFLVVSGLVYFTRYLRLIASGTVPSVPSQSSRAQVDS